MRLTGILHGKSFSIILSVVLIVVTIFSLISCKGDAGAVGPAGPTGNASVQMYTFGTRTTTSGFIDYSLVGLTQGAVDSSMILAWYNPSTEDTTAWYQIPGLGSSAAYMTRYFMYRTATSPSTYSFSVRIMNPNGTGLYTSSVTFTKLKLILAPASVITSLTKTGMINTSDYSSVVNALNLRQ